MLFYIDWAIHLFYIRSESACRSGFNKLCIRVGINFKLDTVIP